MLNDSELLNSFPHNDNEWSENDWEKLLKHLIENNIVSYKEVTSSILGLLNPPQVGTSVATKKNFKAQYPKRECWKHVREWHFNETGHCADCGTRLDLQADHIIPREELGDAADYLDNLTLRCRRCNVIKRPSHKKGGLTFQPAQSALMWILFTKMPSTYQEYKKLCRDYGLTMADVRFEESWAMAKWLEKEGLYYISPDSKL